MDHDRDTTNPYRAPLCTDPLNEKLTSRFCKMLSLHLLPMLGVTLTFLAIYTFVVSIVPNQQHP